MVTNTRLRCPKLPELKYLKKITLGHPRVSLYLQNPLWGTQGYKPGGEPLDLEFLAKNH